MSKNDFVCPKCGGTAVTEMDQYPPIMVHWILKPGLLFNELALGQVVGREVFSCARCSPSFMNNIGKYIACTDCLARHHEECWDEHKECATCGGNSR